MLRSHCSDAQPVQKVPTELNGHYTCRIGTALGLAERVNVWLKGLANQQHLRRSLAGTRVDPTSPATAARAGGVAEGGQENNTRRSSGESFMYANLDNIWLHSAFMDTTSLRT